MQKLECMRRKKLFSGDTEYRIVGNFECYSGKPHIHASNATCLLTNFFSQAKWQDRRNGERNQFLPSSSLVKLSLKSIWYRIVYAILSSNSGHEHKRRLRNYEFSRRQEWYIFLSLRWIIRVILTRAIFSTRNSKNKLTFNVCNKTIYPYIECIQCYLNNCMNWKYRVTATKKKEKKKKNEMPNHFGSFTLKNCFAFLSMIVYLAKMTWVI